MDVHLTSDYPLEAHLRLRAAQVGAKAQTVFRAYWDYYTQAHHTPHSYFYGLTLRRILNRTKFPEIKLPR